MEALRIVLVVAWFLSGVLSAVFVLMHSGEGTGVSDLIGVAASRGDGSLGVMEKNLDRLTIVCVAVFMVTSVVLMLLWPQAPIMRPITAASE